MPKNNHDIGKREERQIVKDLEKLGYRARRQPGSGNRAVDLQHDVCWLDSPTGKLHIESKYRETCAWKVLEKWRAGADILYLRCDGRRNGQDGQAMAYLPWEILMQLIGEARAVPEPLTIELPIDEFEALHNRQQESLRRARIQSAHRNPPSKPPVKRKLRGRGFSKQKVKADE